MKFIFQVEDIFKVKFSYKQISSTKFGISGLANIIEKKSMKKIKFSTLFIVLTQRDL